MTTDAQGLIALANSDLAIPDRLVNSVIIYLLSLWATLVAVVPVLTPNGGEIISWTVTGNNPPFWKVYYNSGSGYVLLGQYAGTVSQVTTGISGVLAYVQGVSTTGIAVTAPSNIITVT